jgi:DNA polymerase-3 subunit delta'
MTAFLATVLAQPTAVGTLRRALASGRVHHAYLFDGPDGVGKERTAFGLAQALVCERRGEREPDACGACSACVRALARDGGRPVHPDVVVIERGLYDAAQIGRRGPETQDISIDQVRTLVLARAAFPPHEGRAKVFIVRRAEELSAPAANALLKTLEEPGRGSHFVLLTSQADALLPTIRSRAQRVRFTPMPDDVVARLLVERGVDAKRARTLAALAAGSAATGLVLANPEASAQREAFVARALAAVGARDLGPALGLAEDAKKTPKDTLASQIEALAAALAADARAHAATADRAAGIAARRYGDALLALRHLDANASPQLAVESMIMRMRGA